jgi:hypothetical protein
MLSYSIPLNDLVSSLVNSLSLRNTSLKPVILVTLSKNFSLLLFNFVQLKDGLEPFSMVKISFKSSLLTLLNLVIFQKYHTRFCSIYY